MIPARWTDPADTEANIAWTRETYAAAAAPLRTGRWLNYLGDDEATTPSGRRTARTTTGS